MSIYPLVKEQKLVVNSSFCGLSPSLVESSLRDLPSPTSTHYQIPSEIQ
jgi:hypothetical protein